MPPKVIAKPDRGILPVSASARAPKPPTARLKLEIRRLPPGLTLTEFEQIVGDEWKLGSGKVDWREYRQGKLKSPGKLPEQSRCYVHLKSEALVSEFEARFLDVVFHDKAGTHRLAELKYLPPTLGFAPNQRTSLHTKHRVDNRQGTIDQDPEFIAFLEAETQPITKPAALENSTDKEREDIKSTPLIDDLRERKANKAKSAASKAEREKDKKKSATTAKEKGKEKEKEAEKEKPEGKARGPRDEKQIVAKADRTPKQGAKILIKSAGRQPPQTAPSDTQGNASEPVAAKPNPRAPKEKKSVAAPASTSTPTAATSTSSTPNGPAPQRQRQRGNNLEGIKKQLHRDLGVKPAATPATPSQQDKPANKQQQQNQPTTLPPPSSNTPANRPVSRSANVPSASKSSQNSKGNTAQTPPVPSTKAYLKHANPSQGMSETLIQQALSAYGAVTSVSIDSRKGTAVAVFGDHESLKKALEAKRVTVAEGAIEVLEFKERYPGAGGAAANSSGGGAGAGGGRGGGRGGRAGGRGGNRNVKDGSTNGAAKGASNKGTSSTTTTASTSTPATTAPSTTS